MENIDVSVIIVNWNTKDLLQKCLESIFGHQGQDEGHRLPDGRELSIEAIVIDNASTDGSAAMVAAGFSQVRFLANETNTGFTRANNQGIGVSRGRYVLLLNSDAEIRGGAVETMVAFMDSHPEVGVVGPKLLNSDGSLQSSRRRFPTLATGFVESTILQQYFPGFQLLSRFYCEDLSPENPHEVDWVVGACLMVRRVAMNQVGLLDETFFMYFEELDWCWRFKRTGWQVVFLPSAQVIHHYGKSSEKDLPHRHIHFNDSKCKFYRKHFGPSAALLLRSFIFATYVFQVFREGLKLLIGHKRELRRDRLSMLVKVLKSGLKA